MRKAKSNLEYAASWQDLRKQQREINDKIYRDINAVEALTTQNVSSILSGITTGNFILNGFNVRSGLVAVPTGTQTINYTSPIGTNTQAVFIVIDYGDGSNSVLIESARTTNGFTVTINQAGTLRYMAIAKV